MDFFDPQKQKRHQIRLSIGYAVIGTVLLLATTILLHWAYGYGLDKEGRVIQNGLVFVSTRPEGADTYLNGKKYKDRTNTRMNLPSGQYLMELKRAGYRDWKRVLTVEGGSVERFDYPMLFPVQLDTSVVKQYHAMPVLSTESLDRRWLLVSGAEQNKFDLNADRDFSFRSALCGNIGHGVLLGGKRQNIAYQWLRRRLLQAGGKDLAVILVEQIILVMILVAKLNHRRSKAKGHT